jgi:hypothetical protein
VQSIKLSFPSDPVHSRKCQNQLRHLGFLDLVFDPRGPILRKVPPNTCAMLKSERLPQTIGALTYTTSPPTGLLGVGLGGDSSPRMIAFQARLEF